MAPGTAPSYLSGWSQSDARTIVWCAEEFDSCCFEGTFNSHKSAHLTGGHPIHDFHALDRGTANTRFFG